MNKWRQCQSPVCSFTSKQPQYIAMIFIWVFMLRAVHKRKGGLIEYSRETHQFPTEIHQKERCSKRVNFPIEGVQSAMLTILTKAWIWKRNTCCFIFVNCRYRLSDVQTRSYSSKCRSLLFTSLHRHSDGLGSDQLWSEFIFSFFSKPRSLLPCPCDA